MHSLSVSEARRLVARRDFSWWQVFELAPGIVTPGLNDVACLLQRFPLPADLSGASVLDVGATNGGAAFLAEARGASRVVAADLCDDRCFGFRYLREALDSQVQYVQGSIYELPDHPAVAGERFDVVLFLGVLYHLRHPLLALDNVRRLTAGTAYLETSVSDARLPRRCPPAARFYRGDELNGDRTNWFSPNLQCLLDWCSSSGFETILRSQWPEKKPTRAALELRPSPGEPEWQRTSYERPLRAVVDAG